MSFILASTILCNAWDGERQGFLFGVGAGTMSLALANGDAEQGETESVSMLMPATSARLGYAWSNDAGAMIYTNTAGIGPTSYGYIGIDGQIWNSTTKNSWFGGLGMITQSVSTKQKGIDQKPANTGIGVNFGYSREVASHVSAELNLFVGSLSDKGWAINGDEWEDAEEPTDYIVAGFSVTIGLLGY